jgi:DnaK suppressor protein
LWNVVAFSRPDSQVVIFVRRDYSETSWIRVKCTRFRLAAIPFYLGHTGAFFVHLERRANGLLGGVVNSKEQQPSKAFIEQQRQRLMKLRDELAGTTQAGEAEETEVNAESSGQAEEYEDDAQRLTTLELDGNLVARNAQRLAQIARALEKISEGSYGLSDASGRPIPKERLEATPEAIYTVAEQAARESAGLRGFGQK